MNRRLRGELPGDDEILHRDEDADKLLDLFFAVAQVLHPGHDIAAGGEEVGVGQLEVGVGRVGIGEHRGRGGGDPVVGQELLAVGLGALEPGRGDEAGVHRVSVEEDRARAALPLAAHWGGPEARDWTWLRLARAGSESNVTR